MDDTLKTHLGPLDYKAYREDWRHRLKVTIEDSRLYYQDTTIANLVLRLDDFLHFRAATASGERELIVELWDAANSEERQVLAKLFLEIAGKL